MSETIDGISDDILEQAESYIKELLKNKKLNPQVRAQLEIQSYFLMFLVNNHERLNQVYPYYQKQKARQEMWERWWDRLQWVVIPMIIAGIFAFLGQFVYFWMVIVPKLMTK
jgi:hypothetical protein